MTQPSFSRLSALARLVRYHIVRSTTAAGSGHPSSSASAADLMTAVFFTQLRADLKNPLNPLNDRVIFSKGHAAPLLYALYAAGGVLKPKELLQLRKKSSRLEGHPSMEFAYTEAATGSLGQGLSVGVGLGLAARQLRSRSRIFVLLGDGEMAEGSVWEAAALASHYQLGNLIALVDGNRLAQSAPTMYGHNLSVYERRLRSFGWQTAVVDGHDFQHIVPALKKFSNPTDKRPKAIIARTLKGKGLGEIENKPNWHGKTLPPEVARRVLASLGSVDVSATGQIKTVPQVKLEVVKSFAKPKFTAYPLGEKVAIRKAYGSALVALGKVHPKIVALDGDVKNSTFAEAFLAAYPKRFFEMYIAEQNMAGAALGFARLGFVPFVSTFAAFWTRAFDQIRMAALGLGNIKFVGSHAGVSIGEDGASQMGLEDLAMFRAVLGSTVFYPADAPSTERLVQLAAKTPGIVYVRTTRPATPVLYSSKRQFSVGGSVTLRRSTKDQVTLIGAGITLFECLKAADELLRRKISARVIDCYSVKPIDAKTIRAAAKQTQAIVVAEDHWAQGGLGDAVLEALAPVGSSVPVIKLAVKAMPHSASAEQLLRMERIDATAIAAAARKTLGK